jgi:hypothetical protein
MAPATCIVIAADRSARQALPRLRSKIAWISGSKKSKKGSGKMEEMEIDCEQVDCHEPAEFTYSWPGKGTMQACAPHAKKAQAVMKAMGYELMLIPWKASAHHG